MRISIVTISFNQTRFLRDCINSVVNQNYEDLEYIVVDPGSIDGSRELIDSYGDAITKKTFEPDNGPADGLNKGFACATGEIYGFLNADDLLLPGILTKIAKYFHDHPDTDVVSGHGYVIDEKGFRKRKFFSNAFNLKLYAYGKCCLMQQSTFFRATCFHGVGGFKEGDGVCWDGELWVDMALNGATFGHLDDYLSEFRIYNENISGNPSTIEARSNFRKRMFRKIMGRKQMCIDKAISNALFFYRWLSNPRELIERLKKGSIFSHIQ